MTFKLDPNLREFATDLQWEKLQAWDEHGSTRKAAEVLGCDSALFSRTKDAVLKKAARQGYAPDYDLTHPIPAGMTSAGTSIRYDGAGKVQQYWNKTRREGQAPEDAHQLPDPKKVVKLSTLTDVEGRVLQQWKAEKPEAIAQERAWQEFAEALSADIKPIDPVIPPPVINDDLMVGYPVGDHHLGMMSWGEETGGDYDMNIGEKLLKGAIDYLVKATPVASTAVVCFLGDFLHYDGFNSVTPTAGNILDSDTRFPKMIHKGVDCMRYVIDVARAKHSAVHVIVEFGNHDPASSAFMALCLSIAYENEPRVHIDISPSHFHYYRFGKVLLATHHGHGTKMQNLPLIMATDRPVSWGRSEYRYVWTGHIHQSKVQPATSAQDYSGCIVESFRILPPADAWAANKGYRAHRDMKAIVYHQEWGEVARHTVNPKMLGMQSRREHERL